MSDLIEKVVKARNREKDFFVTPNRYKISFPKFKLLPKIEILKNKAHSHYLFIPPLNIILVYLFIVFTKL
jgi:hypothetical protein